MEQSENNDPKKKRKRKQSAEDGGSEKEHKKNWRETYATRKELRQILSDNVFLRQNVITGRPEFRVPMQDEFDAAKRMYYPSGSSPLDEWRSLDTWQTVNDRLVNSLLMVISKLKETSDHAIWKVIGSDFVPLFNPLT